MINTVLFDMDGLLIDSEPLWGEAMKEVFASMNIHLTPSHYTHTTGLRTSEVVKYWQHYFKWEGKSIREVENEILERVEQKILLRGEPMEGIRYILNFFKERDFKIGLASSSPMNLIRAVLNFLDIRSYFQAVYSAEHEEYGKPHPAVYLACARELNSTPMECIAFEDSVTGLIAAKAARMKTIVVPEADKRNDPRYVLADLQLNSLLEFDEEKLRKLIELS